MGLQVLAVVRCTIIDNHVTCVLSGVVRCFLTNAYILFILSHSPVTGVFSWFVLIGAPCLLQILFILF